MVLAASAPRRYSRVTNMSTNMYPGGIVAKRLQSLTGTSTTTRALRVLCASLRCGASELEPPFDVRKLADAAGIVAIEMTGDTNDAGELVGEPGAFVARLPRGVPLVRQRFTVAHEIAHAVLFTRGIDRRRGGRRSPAVEAICDGFATELLMPHETALQTVGDAIWDAASVQSLKDRFKVSSQVAARWLTDVTHPLRGIGYGQVLDDSQPLLWDWRVGGQAWLLEHADVTKAVVSEIKRGGGTQRLLIPDRRFGTKTCAVEVVPGKARDEALVVAVA